MQDYTICPLFKKIFDINENSFDITGMGNLQFLTNFLNISENFNMSTPVDHNQKKDQQFSKRN
jgi:hypothetical protein